MDCKYLIKNYFRMFNYLCICPLLWKYSSPLSTSFSTVAMVASSNTPCLQFATFILCFITSNKLPPEISNNTNVAKGLQHLNIANFKIWPYLMSPCRVKLFLKSCLLLSSARTSVKQMMTTNWRVIYRVTYKCLLLLYI